MIIIGSKKDGRKYIPLASIEDTIDFLVVDVNNELCPVYYGDCEDGGFNIESKSLDDFLKHSMIKDEQFYVVL